MVQGVIGERKQYVATQNPPAEELALCNAPTELTAGHTRLDSVLNYRFGKGQTYSMLPDVRGLFSRAWNNGAAMDTDASSRTMLGNKSDKGDLVGTYEEDVFKEHLHDLAFRPTPLTGGDKTPGFGLDQGSTSTQRTKAKANATEEFCRTFHHQMGLTQSETYYDQKKNSSVFYSGGNSWEHSREGKGLCHRTFNFTGCLRMTFQSGATYYGTATLIAEEKDAEETHYLLTCAHNLYDENDGGKAKKVTFERALNHPKQPYPVVEAEEWYYPAGYPTFAISRFETLIEKSEEEVLSSISLDYGLVRLKEAIKVEGLPCLVVEDKFNSKLEGSDLMAMATSVTPCPTPRERLKKLEILIFGIRSVPSGAQADPPS